MELFYQKSFNHEKLYHAKKIYLLHTNNRNCEQLYFVISSLNNVARDWFIENEEYSRDNNTEYIEGKEAVMPYTAERRIGETRKERFLVTLTFAKLYYVIYEVSKQLCENIVFYF